MKKKKLLKNSSQTQISNNKNQKLMPKAVRKCKCGK